MDHNHHPRPLSDTSTTRPRTSSPGPAGGRRLTARSPEDFVAFAPLALGFVPEQSAVMLTFTASGGSFHARVDLPAAADDVDELVETLLRPARRHRVQSVVFVLYDDDTSLSDEVAWSLRDAFVDEGITVIDVLRVWDDCWFAVLPGHPHGHYAGVPFDLSAHPFTAQGVLDGRVTRGSREEVRATLAPLPEAVTAVEAALGQVEPLAAGEVPDLLMDRVAAHSPLSTHQLARLALTLSRIEDRHHAWVWLTREHAPACVELWSDAVRRLPDRLVASPAAVLGFVAWLSGDGALAWCAVDRCTAVEPHHGLAALVRDLLESATSPDSWATLREELVETAGPAA